MNFDKVMKIVGTVKERAVFVKDIWEQASFFFESPKTYDPQIVKKRWKADTASQMLVLLEVIANVSEFTATNAKQAVSECIEKNEWGFGAIMNVLRLCIVGEGKGPDLFDIIEIIGKIETLKRIERAVAEIQM